MKLFLQNIGYNKCLLIGQKDCKQMTVLFICTLFSAVQSADKLGLVHELCVLGGGGVRQTDQVRQKTQTSTRGLALLVEHIVT